MEKELRPVTGSRLKAKRLELGLTVRTLAERSGTAISTISKIENEKMVPTVNLYTRLMTALDLTTPDWFFDPEATAAVENTIMVQRRGDQVQVEHPALEHRVLLHGPKTLDRNLLWMRLAPNVEPRPEDLLGHAGHEISYVIRGELEVLFQGREPHRLQPGDTIQFPSAVRHLYRAAGEEACEIIMFWSREPL